MRLSAAGHEVVVATHERYAGLVRRCGLGFLPLPLDRGPAARAPHRGHRAPTRRPGLSGIEQIRLVRDLGPVMADALADACAGGAEALLYSSSLAPLALVAAEGLGLPSAGVFLQPLAPTREFPPVIHRVPALGPLGNLAAGRGAQAVLDHVFAPAVRYLRRRMGVTAEAVALRRAMTPVCHGFSPRVVRRPADWRPGMEVVGYWWPASDPDWTPDAGLVEFLHSGPPPVFVGFGSMAPGDPEELGRLVARALKLAGVRGVVQTGPAGPALRGPDVLTIGEVPHDRLLPHMSAVIHHAGAGTTAAGLRAGVPAVPVPMILDQPFWASRLTALGVSPGAVPVRRLSPERLAEAVRRAVCDPRYRERAQRLSALIGAEDGAGEVLAAVERLVR
ncbi:glycosyltransferase [Streptomyces sp. NRRL F-4489]|uniref:glycosyltransferase n=1 Tax=Streptomyces sp. NRRL F-4489 TaxID=1609095 RepID=UPI002D21D988|nr:glycosyltransferase [Streptomyces sp. NRRL F-4489]